MHIHFGDRIDLHLHDCRAYQEYDNEPKKRIDDRREILSRSARHNGNARRCVPDYSDFQFAFGSRVRDIPDRQYDEIIERAVQRLRGRMDQRLFGVGV